MEAQGNGEEEDGRSPPLSLSSRPENRAKPVFFFVVSTEGAGEARAGTVIADVPHNPPITFSASVRKFQPAPLRIEAFQNTAIVHVFGHVLLRGTAKTKSILSRNSLVALVLLNYTTGRWPLLIAVIINAFLDLFER
jgi:hypothetical protein